MESIFIFHPKKASEALYEYIPAKDLSVVRIVIAAYLYKSLPEDVYIDIEPRPDTFDLIIPSGVPINPQTPLLSDPEAFSTHMRHSDFDYYTLTHDRDRALQFFRWKDWMKNNCPPVVASPGTIIQASTHTFTQTYTELRPFYPLDEISADTTSHIKAVQRPCPMKARGILDNLNTSRRLSIEILDELTQNRAVALCRTFKCRLTSLDGKGMHDISPDLCVKFYDDRFHTMDSPTEDLLDAGIRWWWMNYTDAETRVLHEIMTYKRLNFLQGSLAPWYYGAHSVRGLVGLCSFCCQCYDSLSFPMAMRCLAY